MKFRVQQYEVHTVSYEVEAEDTVAAIQAILNGEGDILTPLEYVETDETRGMSTENLSREDKNRLGICDDFIPTIRSVEEV
jgi:hypothetical protein